jgi:hypothetical protein
VLCLSCSRVFLCFGRRVVHAGVTIFGQGLCGINDLGICHLIDVGQVDQTIVDIFSDRLLGKFMEFPSMIFID